MAEPEVDQSISWIRQIAARRIPVEIVEETEEHLVELHHTPLGVIGAITPWNFPVLLALWKVAPALITGSTMVIKPSPFTPLSALRFGQIAQSVLPPGVLSVVSGGNELGPLLTNHPDIAKISFTGSTETGKHVLRAAAGLVGCLTWQRVCTRRSWGNLGAADRLLNSVIKCSQNSGILNSYRRQCEEPLSDKCPLSKRCTTAMSTTVPSCAKPPPMTDPGL
jgi:hypothetical protein